MLQLLSDLNQVRFQLACADALILVAAVLVFTFFGGERFGGGSGGWLRGVVGGSWGDGGSRRTGACSLLRS